MNAFHRAYHNFLTRICLIFSGFLAFQIDDDDGQSYRLICSVFPSLRFLFSQSYFENVYDRRPRVKVSVCLFVCPSQAIPRKVVIIKLGKVTDKDMRMHHVLIVLTLIFLQGHTYVNLENNKCSIISGTVQAIPINFAVKIVQVKVYIFFCQSDECYLHSRSQLRLRLDNWFMGTIIVIDRTLFKLVHSSLAKRKTDAWYLCSCSF